MQSRRARSSACTTPSSQRVVSPCAVGTRSWAASKAWSIACAACCTRLANPEAPVASCTSPVVLGPMGSVRTGRWPVAPLFSPPRNGPERGMLRATGGQPVVACRGWHNAAAGDRVASPHRSGGTPRARWFRECSVGCGGVCGDASGGPMRVARCVQVAPRHRGVLPGAWRHWPDWTCPTSRRTRR